MRFSHHTCFLASIFLLLNIDNINCHHNVSSEVNFWVVCVFDAWCNVLVYRKAPGQYDILLWAKSSSVITVPQHVPNYILGWIDVYISHFSLLVSLLHMPLAPFSSYKFPVIKWHDSALQKAIYQRASLDIIFSCISYLAVVN